MQTPLPKSEKLHFPEVDVLRGLAALFMVVNHWGVKVIEPQMEQITLTGRMLFLGSFAPVLFFFTTGLGYGIQSGKVTGRSPRWAQVWVKVGILFGADLLLQWSRGTWLGLDFLAFIGLSMLVLEWVRSRAKPLIYCAAGILGISLLRFVLGPVCQKLLFHKAIVPLNWIFGDSSVSGISYPLSPWLVYPLLGYIVGAAVIRYRTLYEQDWGRVFRSLLLPFGVTGLMTGVMFWRNLGFARWGTMNLPFYIASFCVISGALGLTLLICRGPRLKPLIPLIKLQGPASLAVVPIHYCFVDLLGLPILPIVSLGSFGFYALLLPILGLSFSLSRQVGTWSQAIAQQIREQQAQGNPQAMNPWWIGLVLAWGLTAGITLATGLVHSPVTIPARTAGQLSLCFLLLLPLPMVGKWGKSATLQG